MRRHWIIAVALITIAALIGKALWDHSTAPPIAPMNCPTSLPRTSDLVGKYITNDPRMAGASLDIRADGSFSFTATSGKGGRGKWTLENDFVGCWQLIMRYDGLNPENATYENRPIEGRSPPYTIRFFSDPKDTDASVRFNRLLPTSRP